MLEKGKKIGEYVLLEKLGAGSFGEVWKAEKRTELSTSLFALKFFRPNEVDSTNLEKVKKEIRTWQSLSGLPNVISVIEANRFEDYFYIVSDYADGGSLENWLAARGGKAVTTEEAVAVARQILQGLEAMHNAGFVHRDLKPANVLIKKGFFCLADFGISREIKTQTKATGTAGTMEYMPPEAFEKTPSVTPQTDIWAVGVILQRLLTGKLPFPQDEQPSLIAAILMSEPDEMPGSVPANLREIVRKALQKNRAMRFHSAREMRAALRNAVTEEDFPTLNDAPTLSFNEIPGFQAEGKTGEAGSQSVATKPASIEYLPKAKSGIVKWTVGAAAAFILLLSGVFGVIWFLSGGDASVSNSPVNRTANVAPSLTGDSIKNSLGMEFVRIPAGSFLMGSPTSETGSSDEERPQHRVVISREFYFGKYEVTQGQWKALMGNNPSFHQECGDDCPVERVSWNDAQEFIKTLNAKGEGTYRLPTEAEWEYAARAGTTEAYSGKNLDEIAWYIENPGDQPHPVGKKLPNPFGLYDVHGNVWEWTADWFGNYAGEDVTDPQGAASGTNRVYRGGSWGSAAVDLRSAFRAYAVPTERESYVGLRLVREF
jgi:formylglycine-generating enzyme required for sulfatase activity